MEKHDSLETLLRQKAPALPPPDPARVDAILARLAREPLPAPRPPAARAFFLRPLLASAAALALLLAGALLLRRPAADAPAPAALPFPPISGFAQLVDTTPLTHPLAHEADNLRADLTALASTLTTRANAILF